MYDLRTDIGREKPYGKPCSDDMRDIHAEPRYDGKGVELPQYKPRRDKRVRVVEHTGVTGSTAISHNGDDWGKRWQYRGDPDMPDIVQTIREDMGAKAALVAQFPGLAAGISALRAALRVRDNIRAWIDSQKLDPSIARRLIAVKLRLLLILMCASRLVVKAQALKRIVADARRATKRILTQRQAAWLDRLNSPTP